MAQLQVSARQHESVVHQTPAHQIEALVTLALVGARQVDASVVAARGALSTLINLLTCLTIAAPSCSRVLNWGSVDNILPGKDYPLAQGTFNELAVQPPLLCWQDWRLLDCRCYMGSPLSVHLSLFEHCCIAC